MKFIYLILFLFTAVTATACALQPVDSTAQASSQASSNEVECSPENGCTDGGGGDGTGDGTDCDDRLCRSSAACCSGYFCFGAGQGLVGVCERSGLEGQSTEGLADGPPPSTCGSNEPEAAGCKFVARTRLHDLPK
jgi:hypothetical protein